MYRTETPCRACCRPSNAPPTVSVPRDNPPRSNTLPTIHPSPRGGFHTYRLQFYKCRFRVFAPRCIAYTHRIRVHPQNPAYAAASRRDTFSTFLLSYHVHIHPLPAAALRHCTAYTGRFWHTLPALPIHPLPVLAYCRWSVLPVVRSRNTSCVHPPISRRGSSPPVAGCRFHTTVVPFPACGLCCLSGLLLPDCRFHTIADSHR